MAGREDTRSILEALNADRATARERQTAMERSIREEARRIRDGGDSGSRPLGRPIPYFDIIIKFWDYVAHKLFESSIPLAFHCQPCFMSIIYCGLAVSKYSAATAVMHKGMHSERRTCLRIDNC